MKRFSKMFEMFIIFVGLVVILSCSNQVQDLSSNITYDFSSDGEPIDVIILAGQSNATGACLNEDLRKHVSPEDFELFTNGFENQKIIWYLDWSKLGIPPVSDKLTNVKLGQGFSSFSFGLEIGISYIMNKADKEVIIIKFTSPGSEIDFFVKNEGLNPCFEYFIANSMSEIKDMGYSPKIKCMCWMQGENDAFSEYNASLYGVREKKLITEIRRKFGEDILFIDAQITGLTLALPNCFQNEVNEAKINISKLENNNMLNSVGLKKAEDQLHYDANSEFELGKRFGAMILRNY